MQLKVIIIGGGIGGLSAAIALEKAGIEAHVYERSPTLREVGAGISLWANAIRALDDLGTGEAIRARLLSQLHSNVRTWRGEFLSKTSSEELTNGQGITIGVMHRADLLAVLAAAVDAKRLHLNHECTGFTQDAGGVTAQFANGEECRGDVLIGADGLHSVVRARLFGVIVSRRRESVMLYER